MYGHWPLVGRGGGARSAHMDTHSTTKNKNYRLQTKSPKSNCDHERKPLTQIHHTQKQNATTSRIRNMAQKKLRTK